MFSVAIVDDYQGMAMDIADLSPLAGRADVVTFHDHLVEPGKLIDRLARLDLFRPSDINRVPDNSSVRRTPSLR